MVDPGDTVKERRFFWKHILIVEPDTDRAENGRPHPSAVAFAVDFGID